MILDHFVPKPQLAFQFNQLCDRIARELEEKEYVLVSSANIAHLVEPSDPVTTIAFAMARHRQPDTVADIFRARGFVAEDDPNSYHVLFRRSH